MAWTQQQENAITARGSSVIVSAAAGSGKTAVLTERLVRLISDPKSGVRADRMIVVTFTNDAAAELKKRLDSKLRDIIAERPGDIHLLRQQVLLQNARISTINSFCFELLRDNITDQGITSGFSVLDETDHNVMRSQAMDELINYYSENEYEKISYLYDRFCIRNDRRLIEVLNSIDNFLASAAFRDKWLDNAVAEYKKPLKETIYYKALTEQSVLRLEAALKLSEASCAMMNDIFPDFKEGSPADKSRKQAIEDCERIEDLIGIFRKGMLPSAEEAEKAQAFGDLVRVTAKTPHNAQLREIYKKRRTQCRNIVKSVIDGISTVESDFAESARVTELLAGMIRKYHELLWERKCSRNAISFDDGERLALELLADFDENGRIRPTATAERTAEYYDIIMIDEYQDSNNKEDMIFKLISRNYKTDAEGQPMYGDNVFLVGDVKQSIYGFRLANPRNFIKTLKDSVPYSPEEKSPNQAIILNKNFRSSPEVIDMVNYVFSQVMSEKCGDIAYTDEEKLYFGAVGYEAAEQERKTQITFIKDEAAETDDDTPAHLRIKTDPEAIWTASKIAKMLDSGVSVAERDGTVRKCRPSDFCILVRRNSFINIYANELMKLGVPAKGAEEQGYLRSREIAVLTDLLRVINNPLLDIPMTAVMMSPMYMFSVGDVAAIKALSSRRPLYSLLKGLISGEFPKFSDFFLIERCREFLDSIDSFRLSSVTMTIGELIAYIYDTTDFISVMQMSSDGEKKRANLRALIQYAKGYEEALAFEGSGGLGGFLRHIDRIMETGDLAQGKLSAAAGDYVTVQTFHASKGLEYPFVFIAETSCLFRDESDTVMCSDDGRIGYVLYDPEIYRKYKTFQQMMLHGEAADKAMGEEMRLFYVGMTRARQQLFINLKCGEKALKRVSSQIEDCVVSGDINSIAASAKSHSDWIWASLIRHRAFGDIADLLGIETGAFGIPEAVYDDDIFTYELAGESDNAEAADEEIVISEGPDEAIITELKRIIAMDYDRTFSEMPAKLSVTQITKKLLPEGESADYKLKRPRFISAEKKLTGAERGTAIHTFFQYCDLEAAKEDADSELIRMEDLGYLTPAQADSISIPNVQAFFESSIYRRMCAAKQIWREKKFMVAVSELKLDEDLAGPLMKADGMIKGIIDMMFEEPDGIVIVDYKSDRGTTAAQLSERYSAQLRLYRAAVELTIGKKVKEAYLYSFELKKQIPIELN